MRMRKYLTLRELKQMDACWGAKQEFKRRFGERATIRQVVNRLHEMSNLNRGSWEAWLLTRIPGLTLSLIKNGANVHACNDSALRMAVGIADAKIAKLLLEHGANVHTCNDGALHIAARRGRTEIVELLLKYGANVHVRDKHLLCSAAEAGYTKIVKLLLKYGADIHTNDGNALCMAEQYGHIETAEVLKQAMKKSKRKSK